jgi:hypothetical protein
MRILSDSGKKKKKKIVGERLWEVKCEAEFGNLVGEAEKNWERERLGTASARSLDACTRSAAADSPFFYLLSLSTARGRFQASDIVRSG